MTCNIRRSRIPPRWSPSSRLVLLALAASKATALSQEYCSNLNTGTKQASDDFMTNGKCHDLCQGSAYAVVQYKDCYCSDYTPGETASTGSCGVACPGYPFEQCGDQGSGLYGYIALGPSPKGTQGGSSSRSSPPQTQDSTTSEEPTTSEQPDYPEPSTATVRDTVTETPSVSISIISVTPSTTSSPFTSTSSTPQFVPKPITLDSDTTTSTPSTSTSSTSSSTQSTSSSWSPTPVLSVMTVTGKLQTLTITPTAPPAATETVVSAAQAPQRQAKDGGFFSSPGKVAGTFVAVAIIIAAIIAGLVFFFWRRRKPDKVQEQLPSTAGSGTPQRRPSRLSQMGLLGGAGSRSEKPDQPQITTSGWGPGNSGAERSPADTLDQRSSYPRVVDQRLEPTAVWNPIHDNGSHVSIRSFRDDQDYSRRVLRLANPDQ